MFPVPLNSSKMCSSMLDASPPEQSQGSSTILPPRYSWRPRRTSSAGRIAPVSIPPDMTSRWPGRAMLYARASRVIPSRTITMSRPTSTIRLARSMASSATLGVLLRRTVKGGRAHLSLPPIRAHVGDLLRPLVDEQDDEVHLRVVGSRWSGRSASRMVVLPAFPGETIIPLLPLADGRDEVDDAGLSRSKGPPVLLQSADGGIREEGRRGSPSGAGDLRGSPGVRPETESIRSSAGYFSLHPNPWDRPALRRWSPLAQGEAADLADFET